MNIKNSADCIKESNRISKEILTAIKKSFMENGSVESFYVGMLNAICRKLQIDINEVDTDEISKLCILSIRAHDTSDKGLSDSVIKNQIEKYDCHQTNLVAQKKVLLMLYLESALAIHIDDDIASDITTIHELVDVIVKQLKSDTKV